MYVGLGKNCFLVLINLINESVVIMLAVVGITLTGY